MEHPLAGDRGRQRGSAHVACLRLHSCSAKSIFGICGGVKSWIFHQSLSPLGEYESSPKCQVRNSIHSGEVVFARPAKGALARALAISFSASSIRNGFAMNGISLCRSSGRTAESTPDVRTTGIDRR